MKKAIVLALFLAVIVGLFGCASPSDEGAAKTPDVVDQSDSGAVKGNGPVGGVVTIEEQVIYEKDGIKVTAKGLESGWLGISVKVLVENNSGRAITVQVRNSVVNGVMISTMFSCDVEPGKKANDTITFSGSELDVAGIEAIQEVEFSLHIFDKDSWKGIDDSEQIVLVTTLGDGYVQQYDDSGILALEQNGLRIVTKKLDSESSFWGADLYLYVENDSGKDITVQIRDCSVNGYMVDPMFSCDVLNGKKAFDTITFLESDLRDNDITDIMEMEFRFHVFEMSTFTTLFDSQAIKINLD